MSATLEPEAAERATTANARRRLLGYLAVRVTGLLLAVLVIGHLVVTHVVTDVAATDAGFIARRWSSALWLIWDWLMLASALGHAAAGVSVAVDDYARKPVTRRRLHRILVVLVVALFVFGSYVIAKDVYS